MRTAYFHEDDYCQVEVLPAAAADYCRSEMCRIDEFAEAHRAALVFTDMYMRCQAPIPLGAFGVTIEEMGAAVESLLPPFEQVLTGYSTRQEPCPSTAAWGDDDSGAVFAEVGDGGVIRAVWLSLNGIPPARVPHWSQALRAIPRAAELMIVDWNVGDVVPLSDESALSAYLNGYHAKPERAPDRGGREL